MDLPDPGIEQAQVIVDFRNRANGRAGVLRRGFLFYGDGRTQAFDTFDIRLVHLLQKLPGIGRKALNVTTLSLGIDGIKG